MVRHSKESLVAALLGMTEEIKPLLGMTEEIKLSSV